MSVLILATNATLDKSAFTVSMMHDSHSDCWSSDHCVIIIFWHKKFGDLIVNKTNKTTILLITVPFTVLLLFYFINNNSPDTYIIYPDNGIGKHLTEQELWQITFIKLMKLYYNYYSTRPYHQIHHTLK